MRRGQDTEWDIYDAKGQTSWDKVPIGVLMDIRDELKRMNRLLHCTNFMAIPWKLDHIIKNTKKKKAKRKRFTTAAPAAKEKH